MGKRKKSIRKGNIIIHRIGGRRSVVFNAAEGGRKEKNSNLACIRERDAMRGMGKKG